MTIGVIISGILAATDQNQDSSTYTVVGILTLLDLIVFILARAGPLVAWLGDRMLKMKIRDAIEECNVRHLRSLGVEAVFPETSKRCCFCIPLPDMCCKKKTYERI